MFRFRSLVAVLGATAALMLAVPTSASADISIHFSTGHGHHAKRHRGFRGHSHGPRRHFRGGDRKHFRGGHRKHFRGGHRGRFREGHDHHRGHRGGHRYRGFRSHRRHGRGFPFYGHGPRRGCHAVVIETYDAHGRLFLQRQTRCYDQYGKPYILGGRY